MIAEKHLLTDSQIHDFIVNGFITVTTDLPPSFHEEVYASTTEIFEKEGNPGNNLLPRIPMINEVFEDPWVAGAFTSVLGPDYYMQPHRHCHPNLPSSKGQNMHQDGGKRWSHKTRRLLVFYYPQDTPEEIGPTGIVPGSHYYNTVDGAIITAELPLCGQAGDVTLANYDLWHRAMPNQTEKTRYMMKFLYARMSEPTQPTWNHQQANWDRVTASADSCYQSEMHQQMYASIWNWHLGVKKQQPERSYCHDSIATLIEALKAESEAECLTNAYALSRFGEPILPDLADLLADESGYGQRYALYAMSVIGSPAVPDLINLADHSNDSVRSCAMETLGDIGTTASSAVPEIIRTLKDESKEVRSKAAESLGIISSADSASDSNHRSVAISALSEALTDSHDRVRQNASMALCRVAPQSDTPVPALKRALTDENRYVRGNATHVLRRIDTPMAREVLIDYLVQSRWCSLTTKESTH
ncbi:MAG: HEAT repeat domain-containing protein [Candidatus Poribacteria bacterium]|nr:HEAT repeat domain-containing protein [Candidatus Poribacteria bacterium]